MGLSNLLSAARSEIKQTVIMKYSFATGSEGLFTWKFF